MGQVGFASSRMHFACVPKKRKQRCSQNGDESVCQPATTLKAWKANLKLRMAKPTGVSVCVDTAGFKAIALFMW